MTDLARRLAVARGDEPADTVVRGGRVFCVFTREWLDADVAIVDGVIAGVGDYDGAEVVDASGRFVVPGFVDAHMHIESVKLLVDELERLILPLGTTAIVADPHEIANVLGSDGVHWLLDACDHLQLDVYFMAPSCVPASPFESPRRPLTPGDLEALMRRNRVLGLAEMMNFPGVVAGLPSELGKLALEGAQHVDGHAPGLLGKGLQAYAAAGIRSDHECLTAEEGRERLRAGMWLLIREASMARNLEALLPLALEYGPNRIAFCTDDRDPDDVADNGHINGMVREAVRDGRHARGRARDGVVQPRAVARPPASRRRRARATRPTCCSCPTSSASCRTSSSSAGGRSRTCPSVAVPEWVRQTVRIKPVTAADFAIPSDGTRDPGDRADRGPGRDGVGRARAGRRRRARGRRRGRRAREDRGRRAPPRDRAGRARVRRRLGAHERRARLDRRARRPQPRRRRHDATRTWPSRSSTWPRSAAASRSSTAAASWPSARCPSPASSPTRRSRR